MFCILTLITCVYRMANTMGGFARDASSFAKLSRALYGSHKDLKSSKVGEIQTKNCSYRYNSICSDSSPEADQNSIPNRVLAHRWHSSPGCARKRYTKARELPWSWKNINLPRRNMENHETDWREHNPRSIFRTCLWVGSKSRSMEQCSQAIYYRLQGRLWSWTSPQSSVAI